MTDRSLFDQQQNYSNNGFQTSSGVECEARLNDGEAGEKHGDQVETPRQDDDLAQERFGAEHTQIEISDSSDEEGAMIGSMEQVG